MDVESIRKIPAFLRMTAAEGGWRVAIIDDADTMTRAAQNALLKILEEPPKNTTLILITHRMGSLLPTIRSRAQVVAFSPLDETVMQELLTRAGIRENISDLIALAEGSIGQALSFHAEGGLDVVQRSLAALSGAPDWDWKALHLLAEDFARKGNEQIYASFANYLRWSFRKLTTCRACGASLPAGFPGTGVFERLTAQTPLAGLTEICDTLQAHFQKVEQGNLDRRHGVLGAFALLSAERFSS